MKQWRAIVSNVIINFHEDRMYKQKIQNHITGDLSFPFVNPILTNLSPRQLHSFHIFYLVKKEEKK